jgi:membrane protease YdiL (CAAX protease family)
VATTNATSFTLAVPHARSSTRDLSELILGFGIIMVVLWLPTREQLMVGPLALLGPLALVLLQRPTPTANELGLGWSGLIASWWVLPAAIGLTILSVLVARSAGTFHPLYNANLAHVGGYVLWTIYQQFLLQDYFMPRLTRVLTSDTGIAVAAVLFSVAHLPNLTLTVATLLWGAVSCWLFRRYRSLYVLGLAQGLLGLCFAVCVPDALHHHLRVGLGYLHYQAILPGQPAGSALR